MTQFKIPSITVDAIIERDNKILLIRRKGATFNGYLALPGGYVDYGETVENAVIREVHEEVGMITQPKEILGVYSSPERDPRSHVISIVFVVQGQGDPIAGDDAESFEWVSCDKIQNHSLAFDHNLIVEDYLKWKQERGTYWSSKRA